MCVYFNLHMKYGSCEESLFSFVRYKRFLEVYKRGQGGKMVQRVFFEVAFLWLSFASHAGRLGIELQSR